MIGSVCISIGRDCIFHRDGLCFDGGGSICLWVGSVISTKGPYFDKEGLHIDRGACTC